MADNVNFVIAAYVVAWAAIVGYLVRLRGVHARARAALAHAHAHEHEQSSGGSS